MPADQIRVVSLRDHPYANVLRPAGTVYYARRDMLRTLELARFARRATKDDDADALDRNEYQRRDLRAKK